MFVAPPNAAASQGRWPHRRRECKPAKAGRLLANCPFTVHGRRFFFYWIQVNYRQVAPVMYAVGNGSYLAGRGSGAVCTKRLGAGFKIHIADLSDGMLEHVGASLGQAAHQPCTSRDPRMLCRARRTACRTDSTSAEGQRPLVPTPAHPVVSIKQFQDYGTWTVPRSPSVRARPSQPVNSHLVTPNAPPSPRWQCLVPGTSLPFQVLAHRGLGGSLSYRLSIRLS